MKNLIKYALIFAIVALVLNLFLYGINITGIFTLPRAIMNLIWPINIVLNGLPIILISYVLQQQSEGKPKQDFNKQGYKK